MPSTVVLSAAVVSLALGLGLYGWIITRRDPRYFHTTNLICWLLIALFPVLVLFSFFPQSEVSGQILGFSMTGAVALFVFIWWFGATRSTEVVKIDALETEIRGLRDALARRPEPAGGRQAVVLTEPSALHFGLGKRKNKRIGLITGGLHNVKGVDVWVNSENTNMQMSRFFERSISATIRYLGSRRDVAGDVVEDCVAHELERAMEGKSTVQPGTVLVTAAGELGRTHKVKAIFHVASVQGQVGIGYRSMESIESCVINVLELADSKPEYKSIVFPLLGTGTGKGDLYQTAARLLGAAISHLESEAECPTEVVYFLTWTDVELETCRKILETSGRVVET
jgi:O-acetyl-ADP-ribose deacetylase (regulator of RNase III)